mmetsp:Transcript_34772/g.41937  ORF Transcript_34772/g.41937 Transcript_34772/m.41937 type:complete len:363 (-) Transcript_34772:57-1145(-)
MRFLKIFVTSASLLSSNRAYGDDPLALHHLYEVLVGSDHVISLKGYDLDGDMTQATITTLPTSGSLYQVSSVYNKYGYDPKIGTLVTTVPTNVTGDDSRVVYVRPNIDRELRDGQWDRFDYTVSDQSATSAAGKIVLVGPSSRVVTSDFLLSIDGWTTSGNTRNGVIHEASSMGMMSHYIFSSDDSRHINSDGDDIDLWYFEAPEKFTGWHGIIYDGYLDFTLSSFTGNFSHSMLNYEGEINLVEIFCKKCDMRRGVKLGFPLSKSVGFSGGVQQFSIGLGELDGWLVDPKNSLYEWTTASKCQMIEVLSGITSLKILGDFTRWFESVSIDTVQWRSSTPSGWKQLPPCAQVMPNAAKCVCK